jgi:hypothetical protein
MTLLAALAPRVVQAVKTKNVDSNFFNTSYSSASRRCPRKCSRGIGFSITTRFFLANHNLLSQFCELSKPCRRLTLPKTTGAR